MSGARAAALLAALALAGGLGACGSGDPVERVPGGPSGPNAPTLDDDAIAPVAPTAVAPAATATAPAPTTATAPPATAAAPAATTATTAPADGSGTGGVAAQDEGTATFAIAADGELGPSGVSAPSAVPVTVVVRNDDDVPHQVKLLIENRPERDLAPGASGSFRLEPLAPGSYTMLLDGGGSAAVLQVGPDQGP